MGDVTNIGDYRPHLSIEGERDGKKTIWVMPLSTIEAIAERKLPVSRLDQYEDIIPAILKDWLTTLEET